ncbi:MAG TPA: CapA family protein [Nitrospirota bacterium]|nr:CapA family protein [Nitrospirota bacterium]
MKHSLCTALLLYLIVAHPAAAQQPPADQITIAAVGDLMLGGRTGPFLKEQGAAYPFGNVLPYLSRADVVAGNLESPISTRGTAVENKKFTLRADPIAVQALTAAGIRVVTLANNHSMDFGPLALQDTLSILDDNDILYSGAGMDLEDARAPAILKIKGRTLAFLSYSLTFPLEFYASPRRPGTAPGYADYVKADIERIRSAADLVIVSFHWGAELMTTAKDYQIELGHSCIDWGADLVLGHHPHVLQEIELYKGRLIAYSLGNFVFGSESNRTNTSMILLLTFQGNTLSRVEAVPLDVNNYRVKYRPRVLEGKAAEEVLSSLNAASERFNTRLEITDSRGVISLPAGTTVRSAPSVSRSAATAAAPGSSPRTSFSTSVP